MALSLGAQSQKVLKVAADSWMPYNGDPAAPKPGYVVEMLREIFEPAGVKVEYSVMPYTNALEEAKNGKLGAVIGPDEIEGKDLLLPAEPMGAPAICLLTHADNTFVYDSLRSLKGLKIGVTAGYSYWEAFDTVIAKEKKVVAINSERPVVDLVTKLKDGELDVIAESEPVLSWYFREQNLNRSEFKAVYKHSPAKLYVAFSKTEEGKAFSALFDSGIQKMRASGRLAALLAVYGLKDWQQ